MVTIAITLVLPVFANYPGKLLPGRAHTALHYDFVLAAVNQEIDPGGLLRIVAGTSNRP
jgi:hypothetical protein